MNLEEFKKLFIEETEKNKIEIKVESIDLFYEYMKKILEWNEKINVTAIKDEKEFLIKHYIDSLSICEFIKENQNIIDIGTGAGFPGIPIKFAKETSNVTLIDSVNKKLNVIRNISNELKISKLDIIHARAEELGKKQEYREKFDIATTRAVSNLSTIVEYMLPFVKVGGIAICMKGPNYKEELSNAKKAIELLGGAIETVKSIVISDDFERNIIVIKKVKNTPKNFPRGQGKPLREPII